MIKVLSDLLCIGRILLVQERNEPTIFGTWNSNVTEAKRREQREKKSLLMLMDGESLIHTCTKILIKDFTLI